MVQVRPERIYAAWRTTLSGAGLAATTWKVRRGGHRLGALLTFRVYAPGVAPVTLKVAKSGSRSRSRWPMH